MPSLPSVKLLQDQSLALQSLHSPLVGDQLIIDEKANKNPSKKAGKSKNVKDMLFQRFSEKGFSSRDIPKAIVIHELMGILMLALTWSFCYMFPISQQTFLKQPIQRIMHSMPKGLSNSISSNGFINSRFGSSYIESSCLRKLIRPATLPAKIFLTFKLVELSHKFDFNPETSSMPIQIKEESVEKRISYEFPRQKVALFTWKEGLLGSQRDTGATSSLAMRFQAEMTKEADDNVCMKEDSSRFNLF